MMMIGKSSDAMPETAWIAVEMPLGFSGWTVTLLLPAFSNW